MTQEVKIGLSMGDDTNELLTEVLGDLSEEELGALDVERQPEKGTGLTGEPVTVAAVVAGGTIVISALLRVLERRLEHIQQRELLHIVVEGSKGNPSLTEPLAGIAKKFADVSIKYGLAKEAWIARGESGAGESSDGTPSVADRPSS